MTINMKLISSFLIPNILFAVTISTAQVDNNRHGDNSLETILTPSNISTLVNLGYYPLDGSILAQPLYIPSLNISGASCAPSCNVIFAATLNNTIYALNADIPGSSPLWSINFGTPYSGYINKQQDHRWYDKPVGIVSTPVIDISSDMLYTVTLSNTPIYTLRKINIITGSQMLSINISGSVNGTGGGSSGGTLTFDSTLHNQREALTLANGNIYIGFASLYAEVGINYHGWVFAYNEVTLSQIGIFCTTPNGTGGGVWESSGGFVVDSSENIYALTGNGDWDGVSNFSQSVLKLSSTLELLDWFTPSDESSTSPIDADIASGRLMLINSKYLTFSSKDGQLWVLDSTSLGHLQGTGTPPSQVFMITSFTPSDSSGTYGGNFLNNIGYFPISNNSIFAFNFSIISNTYSTTPIAITKAAYFQSSMMGTSNLGEDSILWGVTVSAPADISPQPCIIRAWNPLTMEEYWNSGTIGTVAKFNPPLVVNGRVYQGTNEGNLVVFGLPTIISPINVTGILKSQ